MPPGPEDIAREQIDRMLVSAGWAVQDAKAVNLYAKQGVAIREFELKPGFGTADYLLYVDGKAAGVIGSIDVEGLRLSLLGCRIPCASMLA